MKFDADDNDDLTPLIRRADDDAAISELVPAGAFAASVRKRWTRRRQVRTGVASAAVALVAVALSVWKLADGGQTAPPRVAAVDVSPVQNVSLASIQITLDQLERECELRESAVARMLASERRRGAGKPHTPGAPAIDPGWQREQAALVLVRQGDRLAQDLNLPRSAAAAYRQARDTFPGTHWAAIADARLSERESIH